MTAGVRGRGVRLLLLFLAGVLVRLPVVGLPVDGEAARLASRAEGMATERAFTPPGTEGTGPLLPMLLAIPVASGAAPTAALRLTTLLLAACLGPLTLALGAAVGLAPRVAGSAALLVAVHPLLVLGAGGALTGAQPLEGVLLAAGLLLATSPRLARRRAGGVTGALLVLVDPLATPSAVVVLALALAHEGVRRWRYGLVLLAAGLLLLAPLPRAATPEVLDRLLALVLALGLAALAVLVPALPEGAAALARQGALARAGLLAAGLGLAVRTLAPFEGAVTASERGLLHAAAAVPWILLAAGQGVAVGRPSRAPHRERTALGLALASTLLLTTGWVPRWLGLRGGGAAARLAHLGAAVAEARTVAGEDGWVAFDLPAEEPHTVARLVDHVRPLVAGSVDASAAGALPPGEIAEGRIVGLVTTREDLGTVSTLGGRGIYAQALVARHGPWLVLRVQRP